MPTSSDQNENVFQQIEDSANYYEPAVYELLTFYSSTRFESDELDGQFIPTTSVPSLDPSDALIFAVGVLPPSSNVTAHFLDRSASVANAGLPVDADNLDPTTGKPKVTAGGQPIPAGPKATDDPSFQAQYVAMCNRLGCQPEALAQVMYHESGFSASASNVSADGHVNAQGLNQLSYAVAVPKLMDQATFDNFNKLSPTQQLPYIEKYYGGRIRGKTAAQIYAVNAGGFNNPDGSLYNVRAKELGYAHPDAQVAGYKGNTIFDKDKKGYITPEDLAASLRPLPPSVQAQLAAGKASLGMDQGTSVVDAGTNAVTNYSTTGSANASSAAQTLAKIADRDLNTTGLGLLYLAAQGAEILATLQAIDRMKNTPPLQMLVNPQSFRTSDDKIVADGNRGRNGPIVEHWGDNQLKIEASGKLAGYYSIDATGIPGSTAGASGSSPGLGRTARQYSQSYQNFMSLYLLYKNNGGVWLQDYINSNSSKRTNLSAVGSIYIYYDNILYFGSFDNFTITENDTGPFTLEYSFSFTARAAFLLDQPQDQTFTYGAPQSLNTGQSNTTVSVANQSTPTSVASTSAQPSPDVAPPATLSFAEIAARSAALDKANGA